MLGMTVFAVVFYRVRQASVKARFFIYIIENVFMVMTLHAKLALLGLV